MKYLRNNDNFLCVKYNYLTVSFLLGLSLPYMESKNRPTNTINVLIHCLGKRLLPKINIDPKTVKNFLVVVIMEHGNGPNSATVKNMKYCPNAPAKENVEICQIVDG